MNLSKVGKDLIKNYEGCRLTAYKALETERFWTIGYGHYGADVKQGQTITQAQADALFDKDIERYVDAVRRHKMAFNPNQNQFDALCSFTYNLGTGIIRDFDGKTAAQVANGMLLYVKSSGVRIEGLVNRRNKEVALFNTPVGTSIFPLPLKMKSDAMSYDGEVKIFNKGDLLTADAENQWAYAIELDGKRCWVEKANVKLLGLTDERYKRFRLQVIDYPCRAWAKEIKPFYAGELITVQWEMSGYYALDIDGARAYIRKNATMNR